MTANPAFLMVGFIIEMESVGAPAVELDRTVSSSFAEVVRGQRERV